MESRIDKFERIRSKVEIEATILQLLTNSNQLSKKISNFCNSQPIRTNLIKKDVQFFQFPTNSNRFDKKKRPISINVSIFLRLC